MLDKFHVVFGNVLPNEILLEDFYTARQSDLCHKFDGGGVVSVNC